MSVHDQIVAQQAREEAERLQRFLQVLRTSDDEDRRAGVVEAAGKSSLDLTEIVPLALADPAPEVRAAGARAAGAGGFSAAHDALRRLAAEDGGIVVRMEAIVALERLGYDYPELAAALPGGAQRRLAELRRVVRRPLGITWRRTWTYVLGLVVTMVIARLLRSATDGRSDDVLAVLGVLFLVLVVGGALWRGVRERRAAAIARNDRCN